MADEAGTETNPQQPDLAIEAEARRGGWKPQDQWHGAPEAWVDASTFVQRGREVLPHVQREASQLRRELESERQARLATEQRLAETQQQIAGLTQFQQELAGRERERIRNELAGELRVAREKGDTQAEARILNQLAAPPPAPKPPAPNTNGGQPPAQRQQIPQEMTDWVAQNDWYQRDQVLAQAMTVVGAELRTGGKLAGLSLTDQLNETAKVVLQRYSPAQRPANGGGSRVEGGGRPSGPQGGGQPVEGSFEALPAQAKAECDAQGERMGLIGKGRAFADLAAWRKHYAQQLSRYAPGVGYDYKPQGN
jgi:hypothetical protein